MADSALSVDGAPLPDGARLIHIGPPKTGTTALQVAMSLVRDEMRAQGVHYAGAGTRPRRAGMALVDRGTHRPRPDLEHWERLVDEVASVGDVRVVCVSNERFAGADQETAARIVDDLGATRVHVVDTVRRLDRLLPSQWQERIKWRADLPSYDDRLRIVLSDEPDGDFHEHFWDVADFEALIGRWTAVTEPSRFWVIVADENNRELLPRSFEQLLGLPDGLIRPVSTRSNQSYSLNEALFLQNVDRAAATYSWPEWVYEDQVKRAVGRAVRTEPRSPHDVTISTPAWAVDRIHELNERRRTAIQDSRVRLIGDPDRLRWDRTAELTDETESSEYGARLVDSELAAKAVAAAIACTLQARPGVIGPDAGGGEPVVEENERLRRQVLSLRQRNRRLRAQVEGRRKPLTSDDSKPTTSGRQWSFGRVARGVGRRARRLVGRPGS
jgi:hypothetical protein